MNLDQLISAARERIYASVELRAAIALRQSAGVGEHHRRSMVQHFRHSTQRKGHQTK